MCSALKGRGKHHVLNPFRQSRGTTSEENLSGKVGGVFEIKRG
jgi:hypothetical protein